MSVHHEQPNSSPERSDSSSTEHEVEYEPINPGDRATLYTLATTYSRQSTHHASRIPSIDDAEIDPTSKSFNLRKYLQSFLHSLESDNIELMNSDVTMRNVNVSGSGSALSLQATVADLVTGPLRVRDMFSKKQHKQILRDINIHLPHGELLVVLGRPGAGCSTLLKTMTGEMHGLVLDDTSDINYSGIPLARMMKEFKGEAIYNQEVDKHFPHLTVGQTLEHAAALRLPRRCPEGMTRDDFVKHAVQVVMAIYGLSHTYNSKVGNDFVRGVSGGERKRVSIAEMALAVSPISAWDNSTRGLDAAAALKFVQSLRLLSDLTSRTSAVAIYQASQAIYDLFDKATVLYEGRQIYFGSAKRAKAYFEEMGWECPERQTTGDFITSVTNPTERTARAGHENKVPRTPDEFEAYWKNSNDYALLMKKLDHAAKTIQENATSNLASFRAIKQAEQAKRSRPNSPYMASIPMQIKYNLRRAWQRAINDPTATLAPIASNTVMALVIGSCYYNIAQGTQGFQQFASVLFFAVLLNALNAVSEISTLYAQRPIVEKHKSYAFYHPWTEAMAGLVLALPIKLMVTLVFDVILYFLSNLRREPGPFFLFFMTTYMVTILMMAVFRSMAALTKSVSQAMALAGVLILAIVNYTGYTIPVPYMKPWLGWIRFINPVQYGFEMLVTNQLHGKEWTCSQITPAYSPPVGDSWICNVIGAVPGQYTVNGDAYMEASYQYSYANFWRNFGILWAFIIGFLVFYFAAVELNSSTTSTAETLVFRRGDAPSYLLENEKSAKNGDEPVSTETKRPSTEDDAEDSMDAIPAQTDTFTWQNVVLDIKIKNEERRLLDNISGWVKPGTLTALMGSSGAGKTTLLDALAQRTTIGVITGDLLVNGSPLDASFARKTGYVQQQDLHLETTTVRESLRFSAMLRQPASVSKAEKYEYVESVIRLLGMQDFAGAVVGIPGEGLNVEQRKLLTIGVELVAKPKLLLFLDEPTSGLDSQSSWAICAFLRRLADAGQAVLCTIHQPSAVLFQQFDRLLFLKSGGKTVYFGDIGGNSRTLLEYFERNGGRHCGEDENPAEYMLEMVNDNNHDWHDTWKASREFTAVEDELARIRSAAGKERPSSSDSHDAEVDSNAEFAMPFAHQFWHVLVRVSQQYWRTPSYIFAKLALCAAAGIFIGFSVFLADDSQQGFQNVLFSLFLVGSIFSTVVEQIQPMFVTQRDLYEVRERPSRAYSWKAFVLAQIVVEIPWQILSGVIIFASFYYPVVGAGATSDRQVLVLLNCVALFIYASTFAQMVVAALPDAATASAVVVLLFAMSLTFCGVIQTPAALPGFWTFMYRVSYFTYWVAAMAAPMLWGRDVVCAPKELSVFNPPDGLTCGAYMAPHQAQAMGTLLNPDATSDCGYCALSSANTFLTASNITFEDRWRNFGLQWVYIVFNIGATVFLYWYFRARKMSVKQK